MNKDYFTQEDVIRRPSVTLYKPQGEVLAPEVDNRVMNKIKAVFGENSDMAISVMLCESGGRIDVISRTSDVGLFQINLSAHGFKIAPTRAEQIAWLQNPDNNIAFAYELFSKRGNWNDWVCCTKKLI